MDRATTRKARESWQLLTIMAEFIEATERLPELRPTVSVFGSARILRGNRHYRLCAEIGRKLSDAGFFVIE